MAETAEQLTVPEQLAAATALREASVAWRKGWGIGLEMSETRGKNRGKHLFETNIYIYMCVYIYMVPPPRPTFSTYIQIQTIYIVQLYQVSGMFVESQVSRFKSDKWRLLSFSSLTISPSWIQDPRFPGGLGPGILDPGGLAGSKIQDPRFRGVLAQESWIRGSKISQEESLGILDLGSWLAGSKISQEESLGILDLGSWLAGSKISQEEFLFWLGGSKISQEESLGILDLGS